MKLKSRIFQLLIFCWVLFVSIQIAEADEYILIKVSGFEGQYLYYETETGKKEIINAIRENTFLINKDFAIKEKDFLTITLLFPNFEKATGTGYSIGNEEPWKRESNKIELYLYNECNISIYANLNKELGIVDYRLSEIGSIKNNEWMLQFNKVYNLLDAQYYLKIQEIENLAKESGLSYASKSDLPKIKQISGISEMDKETIQIQQKKIDLIILVIKENKEDILGVMLLNRFKNQLNDNQLVRNLFQSFPVNYQSSFFGKQIQQFMSEWKTT